jgi:hypothetical protein
MRPLLLALSWLAACLTVAAPASANDLSGTVLDAMRQPVADAHVFVYAAYPKVGVSSFCPTCYRDCVKHQEVDAHGSFRLEELNRTLVFDVLAVADGYQSVLLRRVNPDAGPLQVELSCRDAADANRLVHGVVLDPAGKPVAGAVVTPQGYHFGGGRIAWGNYPGVEKLAVTDLKGEFSLRLPSAEGKIDVRVQGRSLARRIERALAPGEVRPIPLADGVTITGHLTRGGEPVRDVRVTLVQRNRASANYLGHDEIATNEDGLFVFTNIAPDETYFIYAAMADLSGGHVEPRIVRTGEDGTVVDAGTLEVTHGRRIAGTVVLPDGMRMPGIAELRLLHFASDDSVAIQLPPSGAFAFDDAPFGELTLRLHLPGFGRARATLGPRDHPEEMTIAAGGDCTDVRIELERR